MNELRVRLRRLADARSGPVDEVRVDREDSVVFHRGDDRPALSGRDVTRLGGIRGPTGLVDHRRGEKQPNPHDRPEPHQPARTSRRRGGGGVREARSSGALPVMRTVGILVVLAVALVASAAAGILVGAVAIAPGDVVAALFGSNETSGTIIRELRLPRVFGAALVGGALATAGARLQA